MLARQAVIPIVLLTTTLACSDSETPASELDEPVLGSTSSPADVGSAPNMGTAPPNPGGTSDGTPSAGPTPTQPQQPTGSASPNPASSPSAGGTTTAPTEPLPSGPDATPSGPSGEPSPPAGGAGNGSPPGPTEPESGAGGAGPNPTTPDPSSEPESESPPPDNATIVPDPSWTCGMPDGVPPPQDGELVFTATLEIANVYDYGVTPYGARRVLDVNGGSFTGDAISGMVQRGGLDLELTLENGALELEEINILRTQDGTNVLFTSCGFAADAEAPVRMVFDFEAPNSSSAAWLNDGVFAGTRTFDPATNRIELSVYDISDLVPGPPSIELRDPVGVPNQPTECSTLTGGRGATVLTADVTLGSSISIGQSKRGGRNIIPITGGTVSGRVTGRVVPGGADYQLSSGATVLDARYSLETDDGEFILIRNCGPFGAMVPLFETRAASPYAYLNQGTFVSADPGVGGGGVRIVFHERQ